MQLYVVLLFVAVGAVSADFGKRLQDTAVECAKEHHIPLEELASFHSYAHLSTIVPTQNQKCFTDCLGQRSGFLTAQGLDRDTYVAFRALKSHSAEQALATLALCEGLFHGHHTCESSWEVNKCISNF